MTCDVTEEQLWCWIDEDAPELAAHLAECPRCRKLAEEIRAGMQAAAIGAKSLGAPLPEKVGSYVIKNLLGEGGQGLVYEAEQQSPKRSVALKVLKGGRFIGRHDVQHFERESRALAALNHPGIATVYEAGRTEEGQHFFAMELVAGEPLDAYARDRSLSPEERLELFGKVCDAAQYAHEQGVIHRDLKPTNILVDADGNPKVLDFGLARMTDADVTLTIAATETGQIMGTLRYMSPEQARGHSDKIGVCSDVYALGVVLYELLTDRSPYEISQFMPEAVQTICEQLPQKPSSISRTFRGDLETIVLKALEKEPSRRYQSVEELGADVRRYLKREPILAKRPSTLYVLRKRLSRHRLGFSLATAVVMLGVVAVLAGIWQKQRELAEARREVLGIRRLLDMGGTKTILGLAQRAFYEHPELPEACLVYVHARFYAIRQQGGSGTYVSEWVEERLARYPSQWASAAPWALRTLLAEMHRITGDYQTSDSLQAQADRDAPDTAEAWYLRSFATMNVDKALRYAEVAVQREPNHRLAWNRLAYLSRVTGDFDGLLTASRKLVDLGDDPAHWMLIEGHALLRQGRYSQAAEQYTRMVALDPTWWNLHRYRAVAYLCMKDYAKAIDDYTEAWRGNPREQVWMQYQRATPLWIVGQTSEAATDYREVRRLVGPHTLAGIRLFLVLRDQSRILRKQGRVSDAEKVYKEANDVLEASRRDSAPGSWLEIIFKCLAGECTPQELADAADPANPEQVCEAYYYAAEACLLNDRVDEAREWFQKCVETDLVFDTGEWADPMNEYHLALWRLEQLGTVSGW